MTLTQQQKRDLADRIKAHVASLVESYEGMDGFLDEEDDVRNDVREQIGVWMARLPGDYWDAGCFGRRPR